MDKQQFDDAIGEAPPATFDVDGLVTRGRRAVRLHRLANPVVAAAVAVVALTGVIAFTMTRDDDGGLGVGVQPPTTSTESSATASTGPSGPVPTTGKLPRHNPPEACERTDLESPAQIGARLTTVLKGALQAQHADLTYVASPNSEYPDGVGHPPAEFYRITGEAPDDDMPLCAFDSYFMAGATTRGPEGDGFLLVVVQPVRFDQGMHACAEASGTTGCEQETTPTGDIVVRSASGHDRGLTQNRVDIYRPDGTSVMVSVDNVAASIKSDGPPTASAMPLTLDQLVAIGTDPGMTMFP